MRLYFISFMSFFLSLNLFAQDVKVSGIIIDESGSEVPFASVIFSNKNDSTITYGTLALEDGSFSLLLKKDDYIVEVSVVGLVSKSFDYNLKNSGDSINLGNFVIQSETQLDEVVVRNTTSAVKLGLDKKEYDVSKDLLSKGGTLVDVMQNVPSVQVDGSGNLSLRGNANVLILLDSKPSGFASSAEFLRSIPASSIAKVEVITNPSAKFTAEGAAGIINIILKKGTVRKLNGSAEIFTGYRFNIGSNVNLNGATKTGSWYANTGIGYSEPLGKSWISLDDFMAEPDSTEQKSERLRKQLYLLLNVGGDKNLGEKQTLSGSVTYRRVVANNENTTDYEDFNNRTLTSIINRFEEENQKGSFFQGRTDYSIRLDTLGQKIEVGFSAEFSKNNDDARIFENNVFPESNNNGQDITSNEENRRQYLVSADYTLPFQKESKLELGYLSTLGSTKNDYEVRTEADMGFVDIPEFTNDTEYRENVHAFYGQYTGSWNKLHFKLGLRSETTDILIKAMATDYQEGKNYTDIFPSAFLNYKLKGDAAFNLSLSRRIGRPYYKLVVPFSSYTDRRNIFVGNPDINPRYISSAELAYAGKIHDKFQVIPTLYIRDTKNEMEFFVERRNVTVGSETREVFASTIANIGNYTAYGLELGIVHKPTNWWDIYLETTFNGFKQVGNVRGASFNGEGLLFYGRFNHTINLFKSMKLQWQNNYRGPIETGQYRRKGIYYMNLGLSNSLFNDRYTFTVNYSDVLNSNKRIVTTYGNGFIRELTLQNRVPQLNLSLSYRFDSKSRVKEGLQYDDVKIIN
ncbi:outer membrane beta-barrel family protein [Maribacter sp. 4G9]|uniref:outer membrane beta-barrel family protein n=1 Tax=Maribacter sp. 4G9 TaxID=1889777 RepID=UPI000C1463D8|nr:outer membrane beta-barrel family protein [Maribacter sp. 4G9]